MALIKNAYTPGQWYVYFYEAKNVEQSSYYSNVEMQFSSWYSFLQTDQIQGKIFDFLGVPNKCGKINMKQLQKMYVAEKSRRGFDKLDVRVKRIQLNETLPPSTSTFKFFKSKNTRQIGQNKNPLDSMTKIGLNKVDKRNPVEVKSKLTTSHPKPQKQPQLGFSEQSNVNDSNSRSNSSNDQVERIQLNRTPQPSSFKIFKSKNTGQLGENAQSRGLRTKMGLKTMDEQKTVEVTSNFKSHLKPQIKAQLEFSNKSSDINSDVSCSNSGGFSNQSDQDIFVDFRSKQNIKEVPSPETDRTALAKPPRCKNESDTSKTADPSTSKAHELMNSNLNAAVPSKSKKKVEFKSENEYFFYKGVNSTPTQSSHSDVTIDPVQIGLRFKPIQELDSGSYQENDSSNDDDNAFDTGFLSPPQDFSLASSQQSQEIATPFEINQIDGLVGGEKVVSAHNMVIVRSESQQVLSIDRISSRAPSIMSTEDELLSQSSARTEIFATSISVDLRVPGALTMINNEYKRLFDSLSLSQSLFSRMGEFGLGNSPLDPNIINDKGNSVNLIDSNTTFQRPSNLRFPLMTNLNQSQEELLGIYNPRVKSIEYNPVEQNVEQKLDSETLKNIEAVTVPQETSFASGITNLQFDSDTRHDSTLVNPSALANVRELVTNSNKKDGEASKRLIQIDGGVGKLQDARKKSLPLKKRFVSGIPTPFAHRLPEGIEGVGGEGHPCDQRLTGNDRPGETAENGACSAAIDEVHGPKVAPYEAYGPAIVDDFYKVNSDTLTMRKQRVDLAWKLSLRHISESFFNDPEVSTKFREGSISRSVTSSKSTHPRKYLSEEFQAESNLHSSVANQFDKMELNSSEQELRKTAEHFFGEDAVTPDVSVTVSNDDTRSLSPQLEIQSESEISSNPPSLTHFPEHTRGFLEYENGRASHVHDGGTRGQTPFEASKFGIDRISEIENCDHESQEDISGDFSRSVKKSVVNSDINIQGVSVKSNTASIVSSPSIRKNQLKNNSSGSSCSLRVLPFSSQRKTKDWQRPVVPTNREIQHDFLIPFLRDSSINSANSNEDRTDFGNFSGAKSWENGDVMVVTGCSNELERGAPRKRMSYVLSNVIMKPVGAERQSNEHDILICEDENLNFSLHLQDSPS